MVIFAAIIVRFRLPCHSRPWNPRCATANHLECKADYNQSALRYQQLNMTYHLTGPQNSAVLQCSSLHGLARLLPPHERGRKQQWEKATATCAFGPARVRASASFLAAPFAGRRRTLVSPSPGTRVGACVRTLSGHRSLLGPVPVAVPVQWIRPCSVLFNCCGRLVR
jgi:hypothetical protein